MYFCNENFYEFLTKKQFAHSFRVLMNLVKILTLNPFKKLLCLFIFHNIELLLNQRRVPLYIF